MERIDPNEAVSSIKPERKWFEIDLKALWLYRDLYVMYIKRDIVTYYKQTIFGPIWYLIQPLLTTVLYMFIFGKMAGIPTDGIPQPLFYLGGIALWNYFSQTFTACSDIFGINSHVFGKVYFPRLVVPLASCTSNLIRLLIQFLIFVAAYIYYMAKGMIEPHLSWHLLLIPVLVLLVGLLAMTIGMIVSSKTVKYKDLKLVIQFIVQLVMYVTPVIYPLSFMPERYRWIINLNPLTPIFEAFKYSCLGVGTFSIGGLMYSAAFLIVLAFISLVVFYRTDLKFIDTV